MGPPGAEFVADGYSGRWIDETMCVRTPLT
jgi:hypothetical protein